MTPALTYYENTSSNRPSDHQTRSTLAAPAHGLALRQCIKTYKLPFLARQQLDSGTVGMISLKVSVAGATFDDTVDDFLITDNVPGEAKLAWVTT